MLLMILPQGFFDTPFASFLASVGVCCSRPVRGPALKGRVRPARLLPSCGATTSPHTPRDLGKRASRQAVTAALPRLWGVGL
jgi:hypothetical protein